MTISLEIVGLHDGSVDVVALQRNIQKLAALVPDTGGKTVGVRFGASSLTWSGAATLSAVQTVTHGLGKTPVIVLVTVAGVGSGAGLSVMAGNLTTTTFQAQGWATGAVAATFAAYWAVIG